jgi:hypothetical protein
MTHILMFGVVLPLLLSTFLVSGWWKAWAPASPPFPGRFLVLPAVLALSWIVGALGILEGIRFPPVSAIERLVVGGGIVALVALVECARADSALLRGIVRLVLASGLVGWVLMTRIGSWGWPIFALVALASGVVLALSGRGLELVGDRRSQWPVAFLLTGLLTAIALVLGISGSAKLGQLTGIIAAAVGPMIVLSLIRKDFSLKAGATTGFLLIGAGLVAAGSVSAEVPVGSIVLLGVAMLMPWAGWLLRSKGAKVELPVVIVATALVALLAVGEAVRQSPSFAESGNGSTSGASAGSDPNPY